MSLRTIIPGLFRQDFKEARDRFYRETRPIKAVTTLGYHPTLELEGNVSYAIYAEQIKTLQERIDALTWLEKRKGFYVHVSPDWTPIPQAPDAVRAQRVAGEVSFNIVLRDEAAVVASASRMAWGLNADSSRGAELLGLTNLCGPVGSLQPRPNLPGNITTTVCAPKELGLFKVIYTGNPAPASYLPPQTTTQTTTPSFEHTAGPLQAEKPVEKPAGRIWVIGLGLVALLLLRGRL